MPLSKSFLSPYYKAGDPFQSLLGRSTYLSKFKRVEDQCWTDTIARVVRGSVSLDPTVSEDEAEKLFDVLWHAYALAPGRGLWQGGVPNIPVEARYNCHYCTLRSIEDWCWTANQLMCGGGVGVGLHAISHLPPVANGNPRLAILCSKSHPNVGEVMPDGIVPGLALSLVVDDSRQGWIEALRTVLTCAFEARDVLINVSSVRKRGAPIKTFGGVSCGPAPLVSLLRQVWTVVRSAQGRKLSSVDCLDITNHIGVCIKSGNVRRSSLIVLGSPYDQAFRDAKKDWQAVMAHRHSSNNSITFETEQEIDQFDWSSLVDDLSKYGEPGIVNLWKMRQTDPDIEGCNPCAELGLHDKEACCLSEVFPGRGTGTHSLREVFQLATRYTLRQRLTPMVDPVADAVRKRTMRIGVGLGGICDFPWTVEDLEDMYRMVQSEAYRYADALRVARPIAVTTVKPSGSISLLNGSSPGIHAPFAPFYIRRTRISKLEPMAVALQEAGVPHEECVYDSTGNTLVFSFPMRSSATVTVQNQTVRDQIERQVAVQRYYSDNAVSSTISFAEHEKDELAGLLKKYAKDLKSISCLPQSHGYSQPPYEAISEDEYIRLHMAIDHDHPLTSEGGDLEIEECAGSVCPIR